MLIVSIVFFCLNVFPSLYSQVNPFQNKKVEEWSKLIVAEDNKIPADNMSKSIVQYVVVRKDLIKELKWPTGALIAQACHACTAAIHLFYNDEHTQTYLADLDRMHKVILEAPNEDSLRKLSETLTTNNVDHKLWMEQPENIPTCVAAKPSPKEDIQAYFKEFKLFR